MLAVAIPCRELRFRVTLMVPTLPAHPLRARLKSHIHEHKSETQIAYNKSIQFRSRSPVASALRVTPATLADVPRDLIDSRVVAAMIAAENISPVGLAFRNWDQSLGLRVQILCQIRRVHHPLWSGK